ncbi:MAG: type I-C CRISPR-associated protein Cas8c/Csd1 [Candidatus Competibacter denitrificans]
MILQALCDYYQRQQEQLPPPGFERKAIPFIIILDQDGKFLGIEDTRNGNNKWDKGRLFKVPQGAANRTAGIEPNLLWDRADYALGIVTESRISKLQGAKKKKEEDQIPRRHQAFIQRIRNTFPDPIIDEGVKAVLAFLDRADFKALRAHPTWSDLTNSVEPLSFRLYSDLEALVCQRESVQKIIASKNMSGISQGHCLVTGKHDAIAEFHDFIKGVYGGNAKKNGGKLISFNFDAACSYGKKQNQNAPISQYAAFAYSTALNNLLRAGSRQKLPIGEDIFVFWSEKPDPAEELFADWLQPDPDDPARGVEAIRVLYRAPTKSGIRPLDQDETRFFVLGLAPNVARLSIRLWNVSTVRELAVSIRQHFDDLSIVRSPRDPEFLPVWRLLAATAAQGERENISPLLAGETLRAILAGTPYPQSLLIAALQRIRAEQSAVNYVRAALIKAILVRNTRFYYPDKLEVAVSLDLQNPNIGYRLGRLFAVLERAQELASPGLNATIRDRFYGSASATPVTAFPYLLKLKNHHLNKLATGQVIWLENLIAQILEAATHFPPTLSLDDQGRFAIGYYHQRQDFFTKKVSDNASDDQGAPNS